MEDLYWVLEYARVFIAYFFIMFLWPSVVFKKHLKKKKSRQYKFVFCAVVQPIVVNTAVLGLGLIKCLNVVVVFILFYGSFLFFLLKDVKINKQTLLKGKYLVSGTYGPKTLFLDLGKFIKRTISNVFKRFKEYMKGHWFEYSMLFILVVFGVIYFSVNALEEHSYGFGDLYTHNSWIYNLIHGNIFSGGIYPESMHCLILTEHACFGMSTYNALLFTGPIFTSVILVSLYLMFRELFHWKYSPMIAMALVLVIDQKCDLAISSFSRWQWTMPQEYGYSAMFSCVTYVIRYFKNGIKLEKKKWHPKFLRDDDLFLFTFSLAASIAAHFYSVIMAFMLCLGAALILIRRFFSKKFLPFIVACFAGVLISAVPMIGAALEGKEFEGSIRWALSLILSQEQFDSLFNIDRSKINIEPDKKEDDFSTQSDKEKQERYEKYNTISENTGSDYPLIEGKTASATYVRQLSSLLLTAADTDAPSILSNIKGKLDIIYYSAYLRQFGEDRANLFIKLSFIILGLWFVIRVYVFIRKKINKEYKIEGHRFDGYIVIVFGAFLFTSTYALGAMGLPEVLEQYRVCAIAQIMNLAMLAVPVDIIGRFLFDKFKKPVGMVLAGILVAGVYFGAKLTGTFHGYLMIELTRYNSAVNVTNSIIKDMGSNMNYTIISSTDELYPVLDHGYHEELITFINSSEYVSYTIPTEYLFILIEKNPLSRAVHHVANGPSWIAENKYQPYYGGSVYPEVIHESISADYANLYFGRFPSSHTVYNTLWKRVLLNSKAYVWCQKFNAMYPNELHRYYEDDDVVCYYLVQNPRNLYELAAMDPAVMVSPDEYKYPIWPETYADEMERDPEFVEAIEGLKRDREKEDAEEAEKKETAEAEK